MFHCSRILLFLALAQLMLPANAVPRFDIDLDAPPEKRWNNVVSHYKAKMIAMAKAAKPMLLKRAPWAWMKVVKFDPEYEAEMKGIVEAVNDSNVDLEFVKSMNIIYELESPTACSGVLWAMQNGTVMHGRNVDYGLHFDMPDGRTLNWPDVTFQAIFHKKGKPLYEITGWPFFVGVHTGMRYGGWSFQQNTRKPYNEWHKNFETAKKGGKAFPLEARKALETIPDFKGAVDMFSTAQWIAPQYFILAGTGPFEGAVITADRLGEHLSETPVIEKVSNDARGWHLVQTNDDLESKALDVRRPIANQMLGAATQDIISQDHLMDFLHTSPLFWNGTVFSSVMVPAFDYYKTTLPSEGHSIERKLFVNAPPEAEVEIPPEMKAMVSKDAKLSLEAGKAGHSGQAGFAAAAAEGLQPGNQPMEYHGAFIQQHTFLSRRI